MKHCTKPNCNCIEVAEAENGGMPVKNYPCLGVETHDDLQIEPAIMQSAFQFSNSERIIVFTSSLGIRTFRCNTKWEPVTLYAGIDSLGTAKTQTEYHEKIRAQHDKESFVPEHSTKLPLQEYANTVLSSQTKANNSVSSILEHTADKFYCKGWGIDMDHGCRSQCVACKQESHGNEKTWQQIAEDKNKEIISLQDQIALQKQWIDKAREELKQSWASFHNFQVKFRFYGFVESASQAEQRIKALNDLLK